MSGVTVIVPTRNSLRWMDGCLNSVFAQREVELDVVVVDNASTDGTPEYVRSRFPLATVVELERNEGYAGALLAGAKQAPAGHDLLALNVDTVVSPGCLAGLSAVLAEDARAGVAAPRLLNSDETLQPSRFSFPTVGNFFLQAALLDQGRRRRGETDHDHRQCTDWASGAVLLCRRAAWDAVGGFDPGYPFYVEEIDFQRRLADVGWSVVYEPGARVTHFGGFTPVPAEQFLLSHDGFERYFGVHYGIASQALVRVALCAVAASRCVAWTVISVVSPARRPLARRWAAMFGSVAGRSLRRLPGALVRRHRPYLPHAG